MTLNPKITDWRGRRVWVVGASSGIGRATASALHARGASVIVSARNADALQAFVASHPMVSALPLDVTDAVAVKQAAAQVLQQGELHHVVYCAGHYHAMGAATMDLADMQRHLQVNYTGALMLIDAVLPHFLTRRQRGIDTPAHLSLVGSVAGYRGLPKSLAYGPTKAALINLAETLYLDLHAKNIGVSLINPGFVETPLTAQNKFTMPALITPEEAARNILQGWTRGEFEIHFPKRFTTMMKLLQLLPYRLAFAATRRLTQG
jgi:NAD(P)-dependent dehydrogenase (short-subunit alcohol dehydrogenase family)